MVNLREIFVSFSCFNYFFWYEFQIIFFLDNITAACTVTFVNVEPHENVVIKKIELKTKGIKGNLRLANLFNGDKLLGKYIFFHIFLKL